ncbi:MAG: SpoIID/LytB domain-containing protein [Chlamydiales bacterium]
MRTLVFCGLLLMIPLGAAPLCSPKKTANAMPVGPKIKVLLQKNAESAFLEVKGPYRVIRKDTGSTLSLGRSEKHYMIHALQDGLRWGEEYPDVYQITILPTHPHTLLYVDGIQYKGTVSVYHVRNHKIAIVNEVAIEDFLKSTLAFDDQLPFDKEAMCAIAITARTEAYNRLLKSQSLNLPWSITAQEAGYSGVIQKCNHGVEKAVDWTRYMVLESSSQKDQIQSLDFSRSKAQELAHEGYDAQKILHFFFPKHKMAITLNENEVVYR